MIGDMAPAVGGPNDLDALLYPPDALPAQPGRLREYELTAFDRDLEIYPGITFAAWTYNGTVPGPIIRATEGDLLRVVFKNAGSQVTRMIQLLPVVPPEAHADQPADFIYEPSKQELLTRLVPLYVQIQLYRSALESIAGFFGAQMMAMENATKNAGEMINRYTLQYNRARQAAITKELLEIIGGAEALKG